MKRARSAAALCGRTDCGIAPKPARTWPLSPNGLSGDQIGLPGRILGACDVFCARLEPRVYRGGITPERALEILVQNDGRYDPKIVAALRKVAESITGEKLIADLAGD